MDSVQCRIANRKKPELWIEIEVGVDDGKKRFWKLLRKSPVSFSGFKATGGNWEYSKIFARKEDGSDDSSDGIDILSDDNDGFALQNVPQGFYWMQCGNVRRSHGFRFDSTDISYRMDVMCV